MNTCRPIVPQEECKERDEIHRTKNLTTATDPFACAILRLEMPMFNSCFFRAEVQCPEHPKMCRGKEREMMHAATGVTRLSERQRNCLPSLRRRKRDHENKNRMMGQGGLGVPGTK